MLLEEALKNFFIDEIRIIYKKDIVIIRNPSEIKLYEKEDGIIGIEMDPTVKNVYFVFDIIKKDIDYSCIKIHE